MPPKMQMLPKKYVNPPKPKGADNVLNLSDKLKIIDILYIFECINDMGVWLYHFKKINTRI
jgi:hypothetical protein